MRRTNQVFKVCLVTAFIIVLAVLTLTIFTTTEVDAEGGSCWSCTTIGECSGCQLEPPDTGNYDHCSLPDCQHCVLSEPGC